MTRRAKNQADWGRIGGLTAWSRNDAERMLGAARVGFRVRFERLVDPDGTLDPIERAIRADRARRAHMLTLAARSAAARKGKAERGGSKSRARPMEDTDEAGTQRQES